MQYAAAGAALPARQGEPEESIGGLLDAALDAFRAGRAMEPPGHPGGPIEAELNDLVKSAVTGLTAADRASHSAIATHREEGLRLARNGQMDEARASMRLARVWLSFARFSAPGRALAETLQLAAESYLSYRDGEPDRANRQMEGALRATNLLASMWGPMEVLVNRKIHLSHNVMRVEVRRDAGGEAMRIGASLLVQLAGLDPSPEGAAAAADGSRTREVYFDAIVSTVAELLAPVPAGEAAALFAPLAPLVETGAGPHGPGRDWLALKAAALREDDPAPFLAAAATFLRRGRIEPPSLWFAVTLDLLLCLRAHRPHDAEAIALLTAELGSHPRIPPRFRQHPSLGE